MRSFTWTLLFLLLRLTGIEAYYGIDYNAKAAYFNFANAKQESLYVFALNIVPDTGDVYFHMSGPIRHSWIGVGFGDSMIDAFMMIAYPSADGLKTIISPRISDGHYEPVWDPYSTVDGVYNDTYAPNANSVTDNGTATIIAHSVCRNCTTWMTKNGPRSLDITSKSYPFIFALGPNVTFRSDSLEANIPRHAFVGSFNMNLVAATNASGWYGRVPAPNVPHFPFPPNDTAFANFASTPAYDTRLFNDPLPGAHGALMLVAFVLLFPFGALVMGFLRRVLWHAAIQGVGFVLAFAGFGVALHFSYQYNKSRYYNSPHQIIGFIVLGGLLIQLGLGLVHHTLYRASHAPTPFGRIHMLLGPLVMIGGLVNGGLGFHFADNHQYIVPYAIVVAIIGFIFLLTISCVIWLRNRRKYKPEEDKDASIVQSSADSDSGYEMSVSKAFGEEPPAPYEVPTTPYSASFLPMVPAPYSPAVPYTPISAYTPSSWKKEEMSSWPPDYFAQQHHFKDRWT